MTFQHELVSFSVNNFTTFFIRAGAQAPASNATGSRSMGHNGKRLTDRRFVVIGVCKLSAPHIRL